MSDPRVEQVSARLVRCPRCGTPKRIDTTPSEPGMQPKARCRNAECGEIYDV